MSPGEPMEAREPPIQSEAEEERLLLLAEASNALLASRDATAVVPAILDLSRHLFAADAYAVWRRSETGEWQAVSDVSLSAEYPRTIPRHAQQMPNTPIVVEDVMAHPLLAARGEAYRREGICSLLSVPLRLRGEISGTITFYYRQVHRFTQT